MLDHELKELAEKKKLTQGELMEILKELKEKDKGILECIRFVRVNQKISLMEAKTRVLDSDVWIDKKEKFIQHQHDMFMEFLEHAQEDVEGIEMTISPEGTQAEVYMKKKEDK